MDSPSAPPCQRPRGKAQGGLKEGLGFPQSRTLVTLEPASDALRRRLHYVCNYVQLEIRADLL
jgi:hypothetical protein